MIHSIPHGSRKKILTQRCSDLTKQAMNQLSSMTTMLEVLDTVGALSFPFLSEDLRLDMLAEARELTYVPLPRENPNGVIQEIESGRDLPLRGPLWHFSVTLAKHVQYLMQKEVRYAPRTLYEPNEAVVQRYKPGTLGITPHLDGKSHKNLVILVVLEGHGDFFVCDDRQGSNPVPIDMSPGNLFLMRANGFRSHENTPFHYVTNIRDERYVLGIRQKVQKSA